MQSGQNYHYSRRNGQKIHSINVMSILYREHIYMFYGMIPQFH